MWGAAAARAQHIDGARGAQVRRHGRIWRTSHAPWPAAAGLALQPGLRPVADVARQEVAAGGAVLAVGVRQRRDRAARAGRGIFPRHAGVPPALAERLAHRRAGGGQVALLRQRRRRRLLAARVGRIDAGRSRRRRSCARTSSRADTEAAAARDQRKRQRHAPGRQPPHRAAAWSGDGASSITGLPQPGTRHQRVLRDGRLGADTTPEPVNGR